MSEILVGFDGSEVSEHAVRWAAGEAKLRGEPLVIGHALQQWLYEMKVIEQVEPGHPIDVLVRAAADADLLVVGRRGGGMFQQLRVGSVSHGVLHHSPCPVMIVPH